MITSAIDGTSVSTGTEMNEADFLILIQEFISIIETSLTSVKITSLALSIAQAKVTLSEASVISELTTSITTITAVKETISEELVTKQTSFKKLTGAEATEMQIEEAGGRPQKPEAGGVLTGYKKVSAVHTALQDVRTFTVNKASITKVTVFLTSLTDGSSTGVTDGESVEGTVFVERISLLLGELEMSLTS